MTLPPISKLPVIPLFDQNTGHSFVPTKVRTAVARSCSQGRPSGRRVSASPLTAASTMAALRSLGAMVCIAAIFASSLLLNDAAHAERALSVTHPAGGLSIDPFAAFVIQASKRFGIPENWIRAVVHIESGGKLRARSQKGAMGLMQIVPKTWEELRARYRLGSDPYDPHDNILAGAAYIRELHDRYGSPSFLAAYNAGPSRYEKHLATGRPTDETQAHVATLAPMKGGKQPGGKIVTIARPFSWAGSPLFAARTENKPADGRPTHGMHPEHSTSVRTVVDLSALVPQWDNLFVHRASEVRSQ
jgi:hypothetical protein